MLSNMGLGLLFLAACAVALEARLVHPGVMVTRPMLERIRHNVAAKVEPQWAAITKIRDPTQKLRSIDG